MPFHSQLSFTVCLKNKLNHKSKKFWDVLLKGKGAFDLHSSTKEHKNRLYKTTPLILFVWKNINGLNRTFEIVIELSPFTKGNDFLLSYIREVWKDKWNEIKHLKAGNIPIFITKDHSNSLQIHLTNAYSFSNVLYMISSIIWVNVSPKIVKFEI